MTVNGEFNSLRIIFPSRILTRLKRVSQSRRRLSLLPFLKIESSLLAIGIWLRRGVDILLIRNSGEFLSWMEKPEAYAIIFEAAGKSWASSPRITKAANLGFGPNSYGKILMWPDHEDRTGYSIKHFISNASVLPAAH